MVFAVRLEIRADIGKGIAEQASRLGQAFDGVLDQLGIIPLAFLDREIAGQRRAVEIANFAFHRHIAEFVAFALFHHIGDDEVFLVRRQLGHGGDDAEIGITLGQIELAQLLLVIGQTVRIVAGGG